MTRVLRLSLSMLLLVLVAPAFAEIHPELGLEVAVPDSVNIAGGIEIRDVNGDGYSELLILNANPIVTYSLKEKRVLDFFRYATDGLTRLYRAEYVDGDDRLDVAEAVLIPGEANDTFALIVHYGADAYLAPDTVYSVPGLDSSRAYSMDRLYFADADRDGQRELYARYYYVEEYWEDPWQTEPYRTYYYSPVCYDIASAAISLPAQLPQDLSPFYTSANSEGGISTISVTSGRFYDPSHHGSGSRRYSSFTVHVEGADGTLNGRGFESLVRCDNDGWMYNDYEYGANLLSIAAGDILPETPGLEMVMYAAYSFSVAGPSSWCSAHEGQLVLFNLLDPVNWVTISEEMPCDTSIDQVFVDSRFADAILSLDNGKIRLRDAATLQVIDEPKEPITGAWVGYVQLQVDLPYVAAFCNGRTLSFYALSRIPTGIQDDPGLVLPDQFTLGQPYPNPFNPTVTIPVTLHRKGHLRVEVFNPLGQRVATLHDAISAPGELVLSWDASEFGSGVYLIKATLGEETKTTKAVLVK